MAEAPGAAELEAALGASLPPGAAVAVWTEGLGADALGPRETEAIARAVPGRREEFARGRACAREALRRAGGPPYAEIPVGPSREPVWPAGFVGSITHCDGLIAAVAVRTGVVRGIGIDAEPDQPLPAELTAQVLTPEERPPAGPGDAIVRFSAKEAVHKVVFPLTGVWLDFLDVTLALDAATGAFQPVRATAARVSTPELARVRGRALRAHGMVTAVAWIP